MKKRDKQMFKSVFVALASILAVLVLLKLSSMLFPNAVEQIRSLVGERGLFGTFVIVLIGSTLLPFSVDVYFVASLQVFRDVLALTIVAIIASYIGAFVNYFLALFLTEKWVEKQFGKQVLSEARNWFNAWGGWALLVFGVLPLSAVFDPLTFIAGLSKMDVRKFALFTFIAKTLHFALLAGISLGLLK